MVFSLSFCLIDYFKFFCQITPFTKDGINKIFLTACDARIFCLGVRIVKRRTVHQVIMLVLFNILWYWIMKFPCSALECCFYGFLKMEHGIYFGTTRSFYLEMKVKHDVLACGLEIVYVMH